MKTSFHGIKNTGCQTFVVDKPSFRTDKEGNTYVYPRMTRSDFHVELTDTNGHDLENFKEVLKKYPNKFNPNALHLTQVQVMDEVNQELHTIYEINDYNVELNGENLHTFIRLHSLLKRINNTKPNLMSVENEYIKSPELKDSFKFYIPFFTQENANGRRRLSDNFYRMIDYSHNTDWVKKCTKYLLETVSEQITNFFINED